MVDVNMKEEMCASSRLSLAINEQGQILSTSKDIGGGIPYFQLNDAIRVSCLNNKDPHCRPLLYLCNAVDGPGGFKGGVSKTKFHSSLSRS